MNQILWKISVAPETDQALRLFLTRQGSAKNGDLSRFIEEAVRAHLLELTAEQVKSVNSDFSETEINLAVDEALQWARNQ